MIKIISGKYKGKNLLDIPEIRPTTGRLREALFNIIYSNFGTQDFVFADLCCGTGSIGFEALSRGAQKVIFIDNERKIVNTMERNAENLQIDDEKLECLQIDLSRKDLFPIQLLKNVDIIFLDPPYGIDLLTKILRNIDNKELLQHNKLIFVETDIYNKIDNEFENLKLLQQKKYGRNLLYVFEMCDEKIMQEVL